MKRTLIFIAIATLLLSAYNYPKRASEGNTISICTDGCQADNKASILACKLTSPELQKRKQTVIASLKAQVMEKKELKDGYAFKFAGDDKMIDELTEFIKTERECCSFFTFNLSISGDKSEVWLAMTGGEGTKQFISSEMAM